MPYPYSDYPITSLYGGGALVSPQAAPAGGGVGWSAGLGAASGAAGTTSNLLSAIFQMSEARRAAELSRSMTRGLRREAVPFLTELTGLASVQGKGGVVGGEPLPEISAAQQLLRSPRLYSEEEIRRMQAAKRLMSPRFRSLAGPATGASLARAMPVPSNIYETIVAPRLEAMAANEAAKRRAAAAASAFRNLRFQIGAQGYVK